MDANTYYLNEYLSKQEEYDKFLESLDNDIQKYYDSILEKIDEMKDFIKSECYDTPYNADDVIDLYIDELKEQL